MQRNYNGVPMSRSDNVYIIVLWCCVKPKYHRHVFFKPWSRLFLFQICPKYENIWNKENSWVKTLKFRIKCLLLLMSSGFFFVFFCFFVFVFFGKLRIFSPLWLVISIIKIMQIEFRPKYKRAITDFIELCQIKIEDSSFIFIGLARLICRVKIGTLFCTRKTYWIDFVAL